MGKIALTPWCQKKKISNYCKRPTTMVKAERIQKVGIDDEKPAPVPMKGLNVWLPVGESGIVAKVDAWVGVGYEGGPSVGASAGSAVVPGTSPTLIPVVAPAIVSVINCTCGTVTMVVRMLSVPETVIT